MELLRKKNVFEKFPLKRIEFSHFMFNNKSEMVGTNTITLDNPDSGGYSQILNYLRPWQCRWFIFSNFRNKLKILKYLYSGFGCRNTVSSLRFEKADLSSAKASTQVGLKVTNCTVNVADPELLALRKRENYFL